jgi:hypothetical protein
MNRKQSSRQLALEAARELIDHLDLPHDERAMVLCLALDRFESVRSALQKAHATPACLSAVFAAALEYSESIAPHHDDPDLK